MFSLPGHSIGDAWFFVHEGTAHCYFLTAPDTLPPAERHQHWDIGHAISDDLVHWEYRGIALAKGPADAWDGRNLATGSVIRRDGRWWMAYTGHRRGDGPDVQRVGMAYSEDLHHWTRLPQNPVNEVDPRYYEEAPTGSRVMVHWRDPFLLDQGEWVYQFVCARKRTGDIATRGTVGLARSTDLHRWEVLPPPDVDAIAEELEVPQVYPVDGRWYLVFCTHAGLLSPQFKAQFPGHPFRSADYAMVGDSPLGPFRVHGTGEILPPDSPVQPYASQLVPWRGEWFLLGTLRGGGPDRVCDPIPVYGDATGIHPRA